jgi:hypothetical protein
MLTWTISEELHCCDKGNRPETEFKLTFVAMIDCRYIGKKSIVCQQSELLRLTLLHCPELSPLRELAVDTVCGVPSQSRFGKRQWLVSQKLGILRIRILRTI